LAQNLGQATVDNLRLDHGAEVGGPTVSQLESNRPLAEADQCTKDAFRLATSQRCEAHGRRAAADVPKEQGTRHLLFAVVHFR